MGGPDYRFGRALLVHHDSLAEAALRFGDISCCSRIRLYGCHKGISFGSIGPNVRRDASNSTVAARSVAIYAPTRKMGWIVLRTPRISTPVFARAVFNQSLGRLAESLREP